MITVKEAHNIIQNNGLRALRCHEYRTLYVFQVVPESSSIYLPRNDLMDTLRSVDKFTGEVRHFLPYNIPSEDYANGAEILDFK